MPCHFLADVNLSNHVIPKMGPAETQENGTSHLRKLRLPRGGGGSCPGASEQAGREAPMCTCSLSIFEPVLEPGPSPPSPSQTRL